jgi:hypothetical protein
LDAKVARREIDQLLDDPLLRLSTRNRAFLRYLGERYCNVAPLPVKAYEIAIDVFRRPHDFDPESDPIVRIEASRLRFELERYFGTYPGRRDIRVAVPRGNYIVEFSQEVNADEPGNQNARKTEMGDARRALARIRGVCDDLRRKLKW